MKSSWQTTAPGFGYGTCRTYGGVSLPPGGRRQKDKWKASRAFPGSGPWHRPASLLTKQQANARLQQAQEAKQKRKPRVPGCHLVTQSDPRIANPAAGCHASARYAKSLGKNTLNLVSVKQDVKMEHVSVKQEDWQSWRIANGGLDHLEDMDSLIICDSVLKCHTFPILQK